MTMEVEPEGKNVMCLLTDPEGTPLGNSVYLPQNTGPQHLQQIVNQLLNNEDKLPYAFYISDQELLESLGKYSEKNKISVEKVLKIVYQPQAIFRIRPVHRCSATIAGHNEAVLSVAFSPDGRQLASGSGDTTVRLWDLGTQTPLYTCTGHKNWVLCIAWSPDGKHLVSGSKAGELQCWDPQTGKPSGNPLIGHKKWITGISWEPVHLNSPCRRFVSASKDGDARIWDVTLRKSVICLSGHTLAVTCVKWGGDGVIYTGSQDCTIKVWETTQGKLIRELKGHGHWVNSLALSTEYVLRTGAFDHTCKQYSSPEEMKKVALERYNKMKGNAPERLVSGSDDFTMFLWEPFVSKHPKTRMTGHQQLVNHVYFSSRSKKKKMQQRRSASGRPTGTDGSDFNYRMVVDSRYQKVAKGKSRLSALILIQAVIQLIGVLHTFLFTSNGEGPNVIAISSVAIGSISLIIGELGRRRSRVSLLKVYIVASSIGILLSIACVAIGNLTLEVFQNPSNWETKKFELLEATRTAIAFLVQIFTVSTTTSLISNMSPPKRAS